MIKLPMLFKAPHLNRPYHWDRLLKERAVSFEYSHFKSIYDASTQNFLRIYPAERKAEKLFFFFHGMDGDAGDAAVLYDLVQIANAQIVSLGGRGPAWVSDAFLSDAAQIIRERSQGHEEIFLIGISMGACQVLSLAGLLPAELKQKVSRVFCLMPGADYETIYLRSRNERVRATLGQSVGQDKTLLKQRSPVNLIRDFKPGVSFSFYYQNEDKIMPVGELRQFIKNLRQNNFDVHTLESAGAHDFTYKNFDYKKFYSLNGKEGAFV